LVATWNRFSVEISPENHSLGTFKRRYNKHLSVGK